MPKPSSLFTKLQVRLKRFPRLDDGLESTDEEGESEFHAKKFPNPLFDGEIIETTPKMTGRRQRAVRFSEGQEGDYGGIYIIILIFKRVIGEGYLILSN